MIFKLKGDRFRSIQIQIYYEEILYYEGSKALEQFAQRSYGCHIGQAAWGFGQSNLVEGVLDHGGGPWKLELDDPFKVHSNPNPSKTR